MQTKLMRVAAGLVAGLAALSAFGQIKWSPNYTAAMMQAKTSNKLVMVEFYTVWDIWGKRLETTTFVAPEVVSLSKKFIPVRVNVEKEGVDLAKKFHIKNYPTILFVDKNGNDVGMIDGYEGDAEFIKHVNVFLKDYANQPKLQAKYKANPKNLDAIVGLGVIEADRYHITAALNKLHEAEAIDPQNRTDKLSDLYNAIADHYQNASEYDPAIVYFKKSGDTTKATDKKAYAWLSIATCYMTMDSPADPEAVMELDRKKLHAHLKLALPYIEQTLKLPNLKAEDRQIAENDQKTINDELARGDGDGG